MPKLYMYFAGMNISLLDGYIIGGFFVLMLGIGAYTLKTSGKNFSAYFLSGRNMPWWLLGVSMVATTFSADTPNLVTDIVRQNGVSGNWVWWAFLLTGMLTVFVYAKLWRRSNVNTDLEFYELRYSGKEAAFLRGFRAIYLGLFFNVMIMATVSLAAIKLGAILLGLEAYETLIIASTITVIYTLLGGLRGVILTDFVQFIFALAGSIWAAKVAVELPQVGGFSALLSHENVVDKLSFLPDFSQPENAIMVFVIPLAVQWWSVWYPGSEPGGGGYVAQRMLSAKSEKHAFGATFLFNVAHYAIRPWPWIIVALASLVVFPNLDQLQHAFPHLQPHLIKHDLAYPAMLTFLPSGALGVVLASLFAAFMSTMSTHLNWGASYLVNDVYARFIHKDLGDKEAVLWGRIFTVGLMILASIMALYLENALQAFNILLQIGAGTGLLFILRWFWWRINAWSEISAMILSLLVAVFFEWGYAWFGFEELSDSYKLVSGVCITTLGWIAVTLITPPTSPEVLGRFNATIQPGGPGWSKFQVSAKKSQSHQKGWDVPKGILGMFLGVLTIYSALFAVGSLLYGNYGIGYLLIGVVLVGSFLLFRLISRIKFL